MKNDKKTLKAIALSLGLAAGMMLSANATAQEARPGGLFGLGDLFQSEGLFQDAGTDLGDPEIEGGISNFGIGEDENAPLGSGIAIMLAAGLGYVALKKKEDKQ